jgi:putative peptidoglycan lipid II flippase
MIAVVLTTGLADAYNLANTAPNVVYDLIIGGILAATLVPVLVSATEDGDTKALNAVATVVTVALIGVTVLGLVAAPWIVRMYTFTLDPAARAAQEEVAVPLLRLFIPQVLFYGLTALFSAMLNARRRFAAAAFAPTLNNVVVIIVLIAVSRVSGGTPTSSEVLSDPVLLWLLGAGTTVGIAAMALVLIPAMRRSGLHLRWSTEWTNPAVARIVRLSGWTFGYVVVNQVGFVVLLALANGAAPDGGLSAYSYSYLFFQLPYGLFAVAVITAFLPELSSAVNQGDTPLYRAQFSRGLRLLLVVILPSAVLYLTLATPLVELMFGYGNFTDSSATLTSEALVIFGAALPAFAVFMYTTIGFYARKDTRTPFLVTAGRIAVMVGLAWPLAAAFGMQGVVGAFAVSIFLGAGAGLVVLRTRLGQLVTPGTLGTVGRSILAAGAMLAVTVVVPRGLGPGGETAQALGDLVLVGGVGALTYVVVLALTGSADLRWGVEQLRRRFNPSPPR